MAGRPQPVFGAEDRIEPNTPTELPAELRGVTDPGKIAAYYQRREAALRQELRNQPPPNTAVTITREPVTTPQAPVQMSQAEAENARATLVAVARDKAKQGKQYWDKLSADIDKLMANVSPEDRVNYQIWETCYHTLVGMNKNTLDQQDREAAETATRIAAERSAPGAENTPPPPPLPSAITDKVLPGLGMTEAQYREAQDRMASGVWPLTYDNRRAR